MKSMRLLEEEAEDSEYCKKARMQAVSIRSDNRDRLFKKNRMRMDGSEQADNEVSIQ